MSRARAVLRRIPIVGRPTLAAEVASLREQTLHLRSLLESMNHTVVGLAATVERLNHDVHAGADTSLPLFLGYAERLRLDAETSIGATVVVERAVAELRSMVDGMRADLDRA